MVLALNQTLSRQERIRAGQPPAPLLSTEDLIKHYNCGDLDEVVLRRDSSPLPVGAERERGGKRERKREKEREREREREREFINLVRMYEWTE